MAFSDQSKQYTSELVNLTKKNLVACGYENLAVGGTAVSLANLPAEAQYALIVVESTIATSAIRYLELGSKTLPTSTVGIPRSNGDAFDVTGYTNLTNFRAIQLSAGTHNLCVQYYK